MVFSKLFDKVQERAKKRPNNKPGCGKASPKSSIEGAGHRLSRPNDGKKSPNNTWQSKPRQQGSFPPIKRKRNQSRNEQNQHQNRPRQKQKRAPPSAEALDLSQRLQALSRQKRLEQALQLYWSKENDSIRDIHHACIIVDCCARCGDVASAESIVDRLGCRVNIETQTALLKGYAHAGKMHEAIQLFRTIVSSKDQSMRPNVRTLNTLLRGCLWTAATCCGSGVAGGVITSEEAWKLYQDSFPNANSTLDTSSYEYSTTLLCQAFRTEEAEERIEIFQSVHDIRVKGKASITGGDQAALESLSVVYLALSRAYALLSRPKDMWRSCQRALSAIKASRALLMKD